MKDNEAQNLDRVVRDLMLRDFLTANGKYIQKEARRKLGTIEKDRNTKYLQPPQIRIYEELTKDEKKKYHKRQQFMNLKIIKQKQQSVRKRQKTR
jgi:plasmid maintenance system killer protein